MDRRDGGRGPEIRIYDITNGQGGKWRLGVTGDPMPKGDVDGFALVRANEISNHQFPAPVEPLRIPSLHAKNGFFEIVCLEPERRRKLPSTKISFIREEIDTLQENRPVATVGSKKIPYWNFSMIENSHCVRFSTRTNINPAASTPIILAALRRGLHAHEAAGLLLATIAMRHPFPNDDEWEHLLFRHRIIHTRLLQLGIAVARADGTSGEGPVAEMAWAMIGREAAQAAEAYVDACLQSRSIFIDLFRSFAAPALVEDHGEVVATSHERLEATAAAEDLRPFVERLSELQATFPMLSDVETRLSAILEGGKIG